jgi:hypothetical protein
MKVQFMDEVTKTLVEKEDFIIEITTQILDEPNGVVILIHKKHICKKTGISKTEKIYREVC